MSFTLGLIASNTHVLLGAGVTGRIPVIFAISAITFLAFFWAVLIRKPYRSHHRHHWVGSKESAHGDHKRHFSLLRIGRRHRRRRREDRTNPTLAETGGLPAVRPDDPNHPPDSI